MDKMLSLKEVSLHFKKHGALFSAPEYFTALDDINLEIYRGETLGVIGGNGSGKSTLLRVMAGIFRPDRGIVDRGDATASLLALQAGFDRNLSGADNAVLSGLFQGYSRSDMEKTFSYLEEESGLGQFFYQPVRTYSHGMRARLGFTVSILLQPDVLLLDEVLTVGDEGFRSKAEAIIRDRLRSNQTAVLVSHSLPQVERLCDRALLLDQGRCVFTGDVSEVIRAYKGSMKL